MFKLRLVVSILSLLLFLVCHAVAAEPDWVHYKAVLKHVDQGVKNGVILNLVDYQAIKAEGSLDKAYQDLTAFELGRLSNRNEKLAFYINAYNILAIKMVADHWPIKSIKDVGSFFSPVWGKSAGKLDGKTITLDAIEHKILRPMGEPRIHLAIVCASVSCPDLRNEPYTAKQLNKQLDEQAKLFLLNLGKGLKIEKKTIRISKIFEWFEEDFDVSGGVSAFIKGYRTDLPESDFTSYIPYDWTVNGSEL
jgi:hypothetical protein